MKEANVAPDELFALSKLPHEMERVGHAIASFSTDKTVATDAFKHQIHKVPLENYIDNLDNLKDMN